MADGSSFMWITILDIACWLLIQPKARPVVPTRCAPTCIAKIANFHHKARMIVLDYIYI